MQRYYLPPNYRYLTIKEQELEHSAMRWLKKKHLRPDEIRFLSVNSIDFESQVVSVKREGKLINLNYCVGFSDSPLSNWLECWRGIKSNRFIFPAIAYAKRSPQLCRTISEADVEQILKQRETKSLLTIKSVCATMKLSKVNLHIIN